MSALKPAWVVPGGRVLADGLQLSLSKDGPPRVRVGTHVAHVVSASPDRLHIAIPPDWPGGPTKVHVDPGESELGSVLVARQIAQGLHQVDNPAFDGLGRLFLTQSGSRGSQAEIPLYRMGADGTRDPIQIEVPNPTSLAMGPDGAMYISSRFDGQVYRLFADDTVEMYASELGVPT